MLYPQKGSIAIGSRRSGGKPASAAAVASDPIVAALYTPCDQLKAWKTSGMSPLIRPPKMKPAIGTPLGSSQCSSSDGQRVSGVVKREFGCAAGTPDAGVQSFPRQ